MRLVLREVEVIGSDRRQGVVQVLIAIEILICYDYDELILNLWAYHFRLQVEFN